MSLGRDEWLDLALIADYQTELIELLIYHEVQSHVA